MMRTRESRLEPSSVRRRVCRRGAWVGGPLDGMSGQPCSARAAMLLPSSWRERALPLTKRPRARPVRSRWEGLGPLSG